MAKGHIKIGIPGALRDYLLVDPKARSKQLANPMAAKLGSGLGNYDDMQNFAGWVQESWEAGISKREADTGGTLYSELDTRFPNQVILPPYYDFEAVSMTVAGDPQTAQLLPNDDTTPLVIGGTGANSQIAVKITIVTPASAMDKIYIPIYGSTGVSVTCTLYAAGAGDPDSGASWGTDTAVLDGELGLNYYSFAIAEDTIASATQAWAVLKPTTAANTFTVPVKNYGSSDATRKIKGASAWANSNYSIYYHVNEYTTADGVPGNISAMCNFINPITGTTQAVFVAGSNYLSYYNTLMMRKASATVGTVVSMCDFGSVLWIALSGSTDAKTMDTAGTITTAAGIDANLFARWSGYLWRAYLNDVWYTTNGTTWTGPIQCGPSGYQVRGMAGLGDDMYVSTDEGLYRVGAGDKVYGVTRWNQISPTNGVGMLHHQGSVFIPVGLDLFSFNGSQVLPIGLNREEGLPQYKQGRVVSLCSHNYWLLALVRASDTTLGWSTVWAWNQQGWHYIASLPRGTVGNGLVWDVTNNALWVGASSTAMRIYLPKNAENPYRDVAGTAKFHPVGYMATNWFYGQLKEIYKDFESVYVAGENITATRYVDVYWMDDESTDWELLGTVTTNRQELRWSTVATRPNSRQLKLAITMTTDAYGETPVVNAIRVKFQPMVMDRYRWALPLSISDYAQMVDNSNSPYTAAQQTAHLDTLITRVPPFIFEDVDGLQYEVKVLAATESLQTYEPVNGLIKLQKVYQLTLEQVTTGTYTG